MSAPATLIPPQSTVRRSSDDRAISRVRSQAALVRALLDEVERLAPPEADDQLSAQLAEDVAKLGCRCLELASALANATSLVEHTNVRDVA